MRRKLLKNIGFILAIHLLCLLAFGVCRWLLLFYNAPASGINWHFAWHAIAIGFKFDNLIASYVSALLLLFLTVLTLCTAHRAEYKAWTAKAMCAIGWFYGVVYAIGLIVEIANVRYFRFFDNHLNISVVEWFGFVKDTTGMLFGDTANLLTLLVALVFIGLFEWALVVVVRAFRRHIDSDYSRPSGRDYAVAIAISVLLYGVCFCGIRGSFQRYPLGVSFAYFCDNAFYNKLGVNPIFNIIKSAEYTAQPLPPLLAETDEADALAAVQQELGVQAADPQRPLYRIGEDAKDYSALEPQRMEQMRRYAVQHQLINLQAVQNQWIEPYE